nr:LINE-type retrotransposon LIb DNA [Ipomoea batatas]
MAIPPPGQKTVAEADKRPLQVTLGMLVTSSLEVQALASQHGRTADGFSEAKVSSFRGCYSDHNPSSFLRKAGNRQAENNRPIPCLESAWLNRDDYKQQFGKKQPRMKN